MADITMCRGTDCPLKQNCYRFMAKPSEYWQSYFIEVPHDGKKCDKFWEIK